MYPLSQSENGDIVAAFCLEDNDRTRAMWNGNKSVVLCPALCERLFFSVEYLVMLRTALLCFFLRYYSRS